MGCTTVGQAQANLHSRGVFGLTAITPFVIMVLAALRWLPEKQVPLAERRGSCRRGFQGGQRSLYFLAIFVAACAVLLATTVSHVKDKLIGGCITLSVAVAVATAVYVVRACAGATGWAHTPSSRARQAHPPHHDHPTLHTTRHQTLARISPKIARPAVFFFLREAVQPNIGEAMFFWYTSPPPMPHFSPKFLVRARRVMMCMVGEGGHVW